MAAPSVKKKNGKKVGRPTKLTPKLLKKAWGYIDWCEDNPIVLGKTKEEDSYLGAKTVTETDKRPRLPTVAGFARYLGISRETVYAWSEKNREFAEIADAVNIANEEVSWVHGAAGTLNSRIASLALNQHGHREKSDMTSDGKQMPVAGFKMTVPDEEGEDH